MPFISAVLGAVAHPINRLAEYLESFPRRQKCKADILSWLDGWMQTKKTKGEDDWVWVVVDDLAVELGWHPDTIRKHLKELVEQDLVERRPAKRWCCDRAWAYRLNEPKLKQTLSGETSRIQTRNFQDPNPKNQEIQTRIFGRHLNSIPNSILNSSLNFPPTPPDSEGVCVGTKAKANDEEEPEEELPPLLVLVDQTFPAPLEETVNPNSEINIPRGENDSQSTSKLVDPFLARKTFNPQMRSQVRPQKGDPWTTEQLEDFRQQVYRYAKQNGFYAAHGFYRKQVEDVRSGLGNAFWDEYAQGLPLGSTQKSAQLASGSHENRMKVTKQALQSAVEKAQVVEPVTRAIEFQISPPIITLEIPEEVPVAPKEDLIAGFRMLKEQSEQLAKQRKQSRSNSNDEDLF